MCKVGGYYRSSTTKYIAKLTKISTRRKIIYYRLQFLDGSYGDYDEIQFKYFFKKLNPIEVMLYV